MTLLAASETQKNIAGPIVIIVVLTFGVIYTFGYARAVMHRANKDYKSTKAAVPVLRKGFWTTWWRAVKVGFWVLLIVGALVTWMVHDTESPADAKPSPSPSVKPSRHR